MENKEVYMELEIDVVSFDTEVIIVNSNSWPDEGV